MEPINWENHYDLGFAEESEFSWLLLNRHFPSKIGGKPAWLDLENLPTNEEMMCPTCKEPRILLCQIYCPIDDKEECFHRTIFVFICKTEACYQPNKSENILVLRCQLRRHNEYYPYEPPDENIELPELSCFKGLCSVCGCHGPLLCSRCKAITYCSRIHQRADWKYHKSVCRGDATSTNQTVNHTVFPELQMVIEPEEFPYENTEQNDSQNESEEETEKRRLTEFEELEKSGKTGEFNNISDEELAKFAGTETQDKQFKLFKKTIQYEPDQIIRYRRNGKPVWITIKDPNIEDEIPNCEKCDAERCFEFQIMPQLLNNLKDDNIDWGVIAVYTCANSCSIRGYAKEFCIKQDILSKPNDTTKTE